MSNQYYLGEHKGILCAVADMTMWSEPVSIRHFYPTEVRAYDFYRNFGHDLKGAKLHAESHGIYMVSGTRLRIQLKNGGQTKPIHSIKTPIKPPKVRAGTQTRYSQGEWQKYSKTKGWIRA